MRLEAEREAAIEWASYEADEAEAWAALAPEERAARQAAVEREAAEWAKERETARIAEELNPTPF